MSKDNKPSMYDLFNDDSLWGNQETEDLTHDEIMNTNWNRVTACRLRAQDPKWRKNITKANQRPKSAETLEKARKSTLEVNTRPEFIQWKKEYYGSAEYKEYITERSRSIAKRDYDKIVERNRRLAKDEEWIKSNKEACKNRSENNEEWIRKNCKPVSTPYGVFQKTKDAAIAYNNEHSTEVFESVCLKLRRWYKSDKKPDWKYITWEEYDEYMEKNK